MLGRIIVISQIKAAPADTLAALNGLALDCRRREGEAAKWQTPTKHNGQTCEGLAIAPIGSRLPLVQHPSPCWV